MATAKKTTAKKTISRTNITEKQYVNRPSQVTRAAPTKRAKTRRQTHLDSGLPAGYYPNPAPKIPATVYAVTLNNEVHAVYAKKAQAIAEAEQLGMQFRASPVGVYSAPFRLK